MYFYSRCHRLVACTRRFSTLQVETVAYEPIPFDFENLGRLTKIKSRRSDPPITIDRDHKKLFYLFLNETNALSFYATDLKRKGRDYREKPLEAKTSHKWLTSTIGTNLTSLSLDNRIIVLQRALASWNHSKEHCWYSLVTKALKSCCLNDETPNSRHIVKIFAALSKWRFRNLSEFTAALDNLTLSTSAWTMDQASQVLWSLAHLHCFSISSFDYMNNIVSAQLKNDIELMDDVVHRILNANLIRTSQLGCGSSVYGSMADYLIENPRGLKNLRGKTLLSLSSMLPMLQTFHQGFILNVLRRIAESLGDFTHIQAAHVCTNFALLKSHMNMESQDLFLDLLYQFKESIYDSNVAFVPSLACKLIYSFYEFLGAFDTVFVSKCLSDLNVNLHLLGAYSVLGNLQCIRLLLKNASHTWDQKFIKSINNTEAKLINIRDGQLCKHLEDGKVESLENLKLWHHGMLLRLIDVDSNNISRLLMTHVNQGGNDALSAQVRDFSMFLLNVFANDKVAKDTNVLTLIVLAAVNLYEQCSTHGGHQYATYWSFICHNLAYLGIYDAFQREVGSPTTSINCDDMYINRLAFLTIRNMQGACVESQMLRCLEEMSRVFSDRCIDVAEVIGVRQALLLLSCAQGLESSLITSILTPDLKSHLTYNFYKGYSGISASEGCELAQYIRRCCLYNVAAIDMDLAHTRLFFLQDHPQLMSDTIAKLLVGAVGSASLGEADINAVAKVLGEGCTWPCLAEYLESQGLRTNEYDSKCLLPIRDATSEELEPFKVAKITSKNAIGPFHYTHLLEDDQGINSLAIFVNKQSSNNSNAIRDMLLSRLGFKCIDFVV